jgi:hypothetical protein
VGMARAMSLRRVGLVNAVSVELVRAINAASVELVRTNAGIVLVEQARAGHAGHVE